MNRRTVMISGQRVEIAWTEAGSVVEATVNGRPYKVEAHKLGAGGYWFGWNGRSVELLVTSREQGYDVAVHGNRVSVEFLDSSRSTRRRGAGDHEGIVEVRAPMPGKIVRLLRNEGDAVEAHQGIVVMEAMKMQNEIRSPRGGKILKMNVSQGDAVSSGDSIARIE